MSTANTTLSKTILTERVEGKAKIIEPSGDRLTVTFKDCATAFNGGKFAEIPGKGALNAAISAQLFSLLNTHKIATCFVEKGSEPNQLVYSPLRMIPLEVIVRNQAYGSVCKRFGFDEGHPFSQPLVEYFLKDDAANDPQITEAMITEKRLLPDGIALNDIVRRALQINEVFHAFFTPRGIDCADFKLEFGINNKGKLVLGDELSPDNFRLRDSSTRQVLDKDVFRLELGDLIETYQQLHNRMQADTPLQFPATPPTYEAIISVSSRKSILNPESKAILNALRNFGFTGIESLRAGKQFAVTLQAPNMLAAEQELLKMADEVLSNPVIEDFSFELRYQ